MQCLWFASGEMRPDRTAGAMTERAIGYRIIRCDGTLFRDEHDAAFVFASRTDAERWLLPGERVQLLRGLPPKNAEQMRASDP